MPLYCTMVNARAQMGGYPIRWYRAATAPRIQGSYWGSEGSVAPIGRSRSLAVDHDGLAVNEAGLHRQAGYGFDDPGEAITEVTAVCARRAARPWRLAAP